MEQEIINTLNKIGGIYEDMNLNRLSIDYYYAAIQLDYMYKNNIPIEFTVNKLSKYFVSNIVDTIIEYRNYRNTDMDNIKTQALKLAYNPHLDFYKQICNLPLFNIYLADQFVNLKYTDLESLKKNVKSLDILEKEQKEIIKHYEDFLYNIPKDVIKDIETKFLKKVKKINKSFIEFVGPYRRDDEPNYGIHILIGSDENNLMPAVLKTLGKIIYMVGNITPHNENQILEQYESLKNIDRELYDKIGSVDRFFQYGYFSREFVGFVNINDKYSTIRITISPLREFAAKLLFLTGSNRFLANMKYKAHIKNYKLTDKGLFNIVASADILNSYEYYKSNYPIIYNIDSKYYDIVYKNIDIIRLPEILKGVIKGEKPDIKIIPKAVKPIVAGRENLRIEIENMNAYEALDRLEEELKIENLNMNNINDETKVKKVIANMRISKIFDVIPKDEIIFKKIKNYPVYVLEKIHPHLYFYKDVYGILTKLINIVTVNQFTKDEMTKAIQQKYPKLMKIKKTYLEFFIDLLKITSPLKDVLLHDYSTDVTYTQYIENGSESIQLSNSYFSDIEPEYKYLVKFLLINSGFEKGNKILNILKILFQFIKRYQDQIKKAKGRSNKLLANNIIFKNQIEINNQKIKKLNKTIDNYINDLKIVFNYQEGDDYYDTPLMILRYFKIPYRNYTYYLESLKSQNAFIFGDSTLSQNISGKNLLIRNMLGKLDLNIYEYIQQWDTIENLDAENYYEKNKLILSLFEPEFDLVYDFNKGRIQDNENMKIIQDKNLNFYLEIIKKLGFYKKIKPILDTKLLESIAENMNIRASRDEYLEKLLVQFEIKVGKDIKENYLSIMDEYESLIIFVVNSVAKAANLAKEKIDFQENYLDTFAFSHPKDLDETVDRDVFNSKLLSIYDSIYTFLNRILVKSSPQHIFHFMDLLKHNIKKFYAKVSDTYDHINEIAKMPMTSKIFIKKHFHFLRQIEHYTFKVFGDKTRTGADTTAIYDPETKTITFFRTAIHSNRDLLKSENIHGYIEKLTRANPFLKKTDSFQKYLETKDLQYLTNTHIENIQDGTKMLEAQMNSIFNDMMGKKDRAEKYLYTFKRYTEENPEALDVKPNKNELLRILNNVDIDIESFFNFFMAYLLILESKKTVVGLDLRKLNNLILTTLYSSDKEKGGLKYIEFDKNYYKNMLHTREDILKNLYHLYSGHFSIYDKKMYPESQRRKYVGILYKNNFDVKFNNYIVLDKLSKYNKNNIIILNQSDTIRDDFLIFLKQHGYTNIVSVNIKTPEEITAYLGEYIYNVFDVTVNLEEDITVFDFFAFLNNNTRGITYDKNTLDTTPIPGVINKNTTIYDNFLNSILEDKYRDEKIEEPVKLNKQNDTILNNRDNIYIIQYNEHDPDFYEYYAFDNITEIFPAENIIFLDFQNDSKYKELSELFGFNYFIIEEFNKSVLESNIREYYLKTYGRIIKNIRYGDIYEILVPDVKKTYDPTTLKQALDKKTFPGIKYDMPLYENTDENIKIHKEDNELRNKYRGVKNNEIKEALDKGVNLKNTKIDNFQSSINSLNKSVHKFLYKFFSKRFVNYTIYKEQMTNQEIDNAIFNINSLISLYNSVIKRHNIEDYKEYELINRNTKELTIKEPAYVLEEIDFDSDSEDMFDEEEEEGVDVDLDTVNIAPDVFTGVIETDAQAEVRRERQRELAEQREETKKEKRLRERYDISAITSMVGDKLIGSENTFKNDTPVTNIKYEFEKYIYETEYKKNETFIDFISRRFPEDLFEYTEPKLLSLTQFVTYMETYLTSKIDNLKNDIKKMNILYKNMFKTSENYMDDKKLEEKKYNDLIDRKILGNRILFEIIEKTDIEHELKKIFDVVYTKIKIIHDFNKLSLDQRRNAYKNTELIFKGDIITNPIPSVITTSRVITTDEILSNIKELILTLFGKDSGKELNPQDFKPLVRAKQTIENTVAFYKKLETDYLNNIDVYIDTQSFYNFINILYNNKNLKGIFEKTLLEFYKKYNMINIQFVRSIRKNKNAYILDQIIKVVDVMKQNMFTRLLNLFSSLDGPMKVNKFKLMLTDKINYLDFDVYYPYTLIKESEYKSDEYYKDLSEEAIKKIKSLTKIKYRNELYDVIAAEQKDDENNYFFLLSVLGKSNMFIVNNINLLHNFNDLKSEISEKIINYRTIYKIIVK